MALVCTSTWFANCIQIWGTCCGGNILIYHFFLRPPPPGNQLITAQLSLYMNRIGGLLREIVLSDRS